MFLFRFMQKCGLSSSRAYCIFAQPANSESSGESFLNSHAPVKRERELRETR